MGLALIIDGFGEPSEVTSTSAGDVTIDSSEESRERGAAPVSVDSGNCSRCILRGRSIDKKVEGGGMSLDGFTASAMPKGDER